MAHTLDSNEYQESLLELIQELIHMVQELVPCWWKRGMGESLPFYVEPYNTVSLIIKSFGSNHFWKLKTRDYLTNSPEPLRNPFP